MTSILQQNGFYLAPMPPAKLPRSSYLQKLKSRGEAELAAMLRWAVQRAAWRKLTSGEE
jgi:hypothetical protein